MKKFFGTLLLIIIILSAAACRSDVSDTKVGRYGFDAEVLYYSGNAEVYVRSLGGEVNCKMTVGKEAYVGTGAAKPKYLQKGDRIRITYDMVDESYPPMISAQTIEMID